MSQPDRKGPIKQYQDIAQQAGSDEPVNLGLDFVPADNTAIRVGKVLEVPYETRPKQIISDVGNKLRSGDSVSADAFLGAYSAQETEDEIRIDPDVLELLIEETSRGIIGGPEPTQIESLLFVNPRHSMSPVEDSYDHESRP